MNYYSKILAFIGVLLLSYSAKAQIVLGPDDAPIPGLTVYSNVDTMPTVSIGPGGANQIWNYSGLGNHNSTEQRTYDPSTFPNGADFPRSTFVSDISLGKGYFRVDTTGIQLLGASLDPTQSGTERSIRLKKGLYVIKFPGTFGQSYIDSTRSDTTLYLGQTIMGLNIDSVRVHLKATVNSQLEAWGSITSPTGVFGNTLRQRSSTIIRADFEGYVLLFPGVGFWTTVPGTEIRDTTVNYSWFAKGYRLPVVQAAMDPKGQQIRSVTYISSLTVGTKELVKQNELVSYPNPAHNELTIQLPLGTERNFEIYSISGHLQQSIRSTGTTLSTASLAPGIYFLRIIDKEGKELGMCRFTKN